MTRELHLGVSPLTRRVYAGTLIKNDEGMAPTTRTFGANRQDVTADFLDCVVQKFGPEPDWKGASSVITDEQGNPQFTLYLVRPGGPDIGEMKAALKTARELLHQVEGFLAVYGDEWRRSFSSPTEVRSFDTLRARIAAVSKAKTDPEPEAIQAESVEKIPS